MGFALFRRFWLPRGGCFTAWWVLYLVVEEQPRGGTLLRGGSVTGEKTLPRDSSL